MTAVLPTYFSPHPHPPCSYQFGHRLDLSPPHFRALNAGFVAGADKVGGWCRARSWGAMGPERSDTGE